MLRIGNLTEEVTKEVLQQTLSVFGKVDELFYNRKGVAMVMFHRGYDASQARSHLDGKLLRGYNMVATWADENEELDSDMGRFISVISI